MQGRRPEDVLLLPGISAAIGSTTYEAQQDWEELDGLTSIDVGLGRLSINQQFELFASEVVPILRKRGLFHTEYTSRTLRGHYGLGTLELAPAAGLAARSAASAAGELMPV